MHDDLSEEQLAELLRSPLDHEPSPAPAWLRFLGAFAVVVVIGAVALGGLVWLRSDTDDPVTDSAAAATGAAPATTGASTAPAGDGERVPTTQSVATTVAIVAGVPSPRVNGGAVYLPGVARTLVFGGQAVSNQAQTPVFDETWTLAGDGRWWLVKAEDGPGARSDPRLAYDTAGERAIMFGGGAEPMWWCRSLQRCAGAQFGDTWWFDPATGLWEEAAPPVAPDPRFGHGFAYDQESGLFVLFGGGIGEGLASGQAFGDTWVYDPGVDEWAQRHPDPAPPPRAHAAAVYDPVTDRVLVWGGRSDQGQPDSSLWAYDANNDTWEERPVDNGPLPRWGTAAAYDSDSHRLVIAGGEGIVVREVAEGVTAKEVTLLDSTWVYDPSADLWEEGEAVPHSVVFQSAVYDGDVGKVLVPLPEGHYAYDVLDDVWEIIESPES